MNVKEIALVNALLVLATPAEAAALRLAKTGACKVDLTKATRAVAGTFLGGKWRVTLRPAGAPKPTEEQRAEVRELAAAAGITL